MSDLKLKTELKPVAPTRRIAMVRMLNDVQFFGVNGKQLSSTMDGMSLNWDPDYNCVVVTSKHYPGQERWLLAAGISDIHWTTSERSDTVTE